MNNRRKFKRRKNTADDELFRPNRGGRKKKVKRNKFRSVDEFTNSGLFTRLDNKSKKVCGQVVAPIDLLQGETVEKKELTPCPSEDSKDKERNDKKHKKHKHREHKEHCKKHKKKRKFFIFFLILICIYVLILHFLSLKSHLAFIHLHSEVESTMVEVVIFALLSRTTSL